MRNAEQINKIYQKLNSKGVCDRKKLVDWILNRYQDKIEIYYDSDENEFLDEPVSYCSSYTDRHSFNCEG